MVTRKEQRSVLVLRRYFIKKDYAPKGLHKGDIVLIVRNDAEKEYEVILRRRNKAHSCSCPSYKQCYHIIYAKNTENARYDAAKEAAKQEASKPVATAETYEMSDELCEKLKKLASLSETKLEEKAVIAEETTKKVVEIHGNLNGAQQSASFFANLPSRQKIAS
jgi:hypothetical protein